MPLFLRNMRESVKNSDEKVNTGAFRNVKKHYVGGGGGINVPKHE